jgi:hypothetical protein
MASKESKKTPREEALCTAADLIAGNRDKQYGGPEENFNRIARIWTVLFGRPFSESDVAAAMIAVKMARLVNGGFQADTWIDIAGYAGCGYEVGQITENRSTSA